MPEVTGPESVATVFAEQWAGNEWRLHTRSCCYLTTSVVFPTRPASGALRNGVHSDLPVLHAWAPEYAAESGTLVDLRLFFERMLERELLYIWDDDGPRSVVTTSKLTPNGAEVSALYTPTEFLRKGYATSAVAAASQQILDSGRRFCIIGADKNALGTNRMYRSVGYEPIGEIVVIHLL